MSRGPTYFSLLDIVSFDWSFPSIFTGWISVTERGTFYLIVDLRGDKVESSLDSGMSFGGEGIAVENLSSGGD